MIRAILVGLMGIAATSASAASLAAQDSTRLRTVTRTQTVTRLRVDTNRIRFQRPVSRTVLETAWAVSDAPAVSRTAVIARPRWTNQAVVGQRVSRSDVAGAAQVRVSTGKVAPRDRAPTTASDDSTITRQRSADFRLRAEAVERAAAQTPARLHPAIAANLINELDSIGVARIAARTGTGPDLDPEDEGYSEYVVNLARTVVRLRDPQSVRAVVLGGLGTSRSAQRFVAEQGVEALAVLDTAFAANDATAPAVVTTWAYTLAAAPSRIDFADSVHVYARIVLSAQYYPIAFTHAARIASLFDLTAEVDSIAAQAAAESIPATAGAARAARRVLAAAADRATPVDWLARLRLQAGVLCIDESRLGADACRDLLGATVAASRAPRDAAVVRDAMSRFQSTATRAAREGRMSADVRSRLEALATSLRRAAGDRQAATPRPADPVARTLAR